MQRIALGAMFLLVLPTLAFAVIEEGSDFTVWTVSPGLDADAYQPSSAVNDVDHQFLVLWSQDQDDAGFRIFGGLVDAATFSGLVVPLQFDSGVGNARECSAAFDPLRQRYLAVWSQDEDAPGAYEIYGRLLEKDLTLVGEPFRISRAGTDAADASFDAHRPRVAADGVGNFVVTWSADDDIVGFGDGIFDIYTRAVTSSGQLMGAPNQRLTDASNAGASPTNDAIDPVIAYNPVQQNYIVLYEADFDAGTFYDPSIFFIVVAENGMALPKRANEPVLVNGPSSPAKDDAVYAKNPAIAYDSRQKQFLAVWDGSFGGEPGIYGRVILSDYTLGPGVPQFSEAGAGTNLICIARDPHVTYNLYADRFLVSWSGSLAPLPTCPQERQILVRELDRDGTVLGATPLVISDSPGAPDPAFTATSPHLVSSSVDERIFAEWSGDRITEGEFEIFGQTLRLDTATAVPEDQPSDLPRSLQVSAFPNPVNPSTVLRFGLPKDGRVRLALYDVRGALVRVVLDEVLSAGHHQRGWDGRDERGQTVASGVYFSRLTHSGEMRHTRLVLLK